jgi:DNA-binding transcriptional MocR family regulator
LPEPSWSAHTLRDGNAPDDSQRSYQRSGANGLAQERCRPGECKDRLRQLELADASRAAHRQSAVPGEHAHLTPTFNNPTGALVPAEQRRRLARLAGEFQVPVVEDQALADLWFDRPPPPPLAAHPAGGMVVTVGSLSKLLWGGLRLGWVRAPRHVIARLAQHKVVADIASPVLDQLVAIRLLTQTDEIAQRRRQELRGRRDLLARMLTELLPDWTWRLPEGGVCLWARLPVGDARDFAATALRHRVSLVAGPQFAPGEAWTDHVRLPFTAEPDQLQEGVHRMAAAWAEFLPGAGRGAFFQQAVV